AIAEREAGSAPQVRLTIARETPDRRRDATRIGAFDEPQRAPNAGIECVQIPAWRHSSPHVLLRMKERLMKSVAIESERREHRFGFRDPARHAGNVQTRERPSGADETEVDVRRAITFDEPAPPRSRPWREDVQERESHRRAFVGEPV